MDFHPTFKLTDIIHKVRLVVGYRGQLFSNKDQIARIKNL